MRRNCTVLLVMINTYVTACTQHCSFTLYTQRKLVLSLDCMVGREYHCSVAQQSRTRLPDCLDRCQGWPLHLCLHTQKSLAYVPDVLTSGSRNTLEPKSADNLFYLESLNVFLSWNCNKLRMGCLYHEVLRVVRHCKTHILLRADNYHLEHLVYSSNGPGFLACTSDLLHHLWY